MIASDKEFVDPLPGYEYSAEIVLHPFDAFFLDGSEIDGDAASLDMYKLMAEAWNAAVAECEIVDITGDGDKSDLYVDMGNE